MLDVGFRNVWLIQPHLLFLISSSTGTWFVLSQRSALFMVSGQWISRILLRQELMNVCTLLMVVFAVRHVSALYSRTDLMFELKRRILVRVVMRCDL